VAELNHRDKVHADDCSRLSRKLAFSGVGNRDVYNITAPFQWHGVEYLMGRVEARDTESAESVFFRQDSGAWKPVEGAPVFSCLQDPCVTFVDGNLLFGGVRFPIEMPSGEKIWRMEFYHGESFDSLEQVLVGPDKMKDIRLKQLRNGRIAVLSRPQGAIGGRGKIGFAVASSLEEVTPGFIEHAPLLAPQFVEDEWGGANEAHLLRDGSLGVLGHIACFDQEENRHYYPMAFRLDAETARCSPVKIIAKRDFFPAGAAKRPDLVDVVFTGGLLRNGDGTARLYAGLSDAEAAWVSIPDPFAEYEI